jgi:dihydromethanopterin reductase
MRLVPDSLPKRHRPIRSGAGSDGSSVEDGVADIRAMCAIGLSGQLGLSGKLPWEGNKGREYVADVARFFEMTRGHVIIAGPATIASIPAFAYEDRTICEIRSGHHPEEVLAWFPDRVVFVGGGPPVWESYAPYIRHWDITRLPYDGGADRWFNPAWLTASERAER